MRSFIAIAIIAIILLGCAKKTEPVDDSAARAEAERLALLEISPRNWNVDVDDGFSRPKIADFIGMNITFVAKTAAHLQSDTLGINATLTPGAAAVVYGEQIGNYTIVCTTCSKDATFTMVVQPAGKIYPKRPAQ